MTADQPSIFENLSPYMRTRLMMASAVILRKSLLQDWTHGHEKLIGVILWDYEMRKEKGFKYSKVLKKHAYGRTQNYKLLRIIVERKILISQGNGYYTFAPEYQDLVEKISSEMKNLDQIGSPEGKK
jgi:hypothetical protein